MADQPILFSGPMVRSLLDDRKTRTRRVIDFPGVAAVHAFVPVGTDRQGRRVYEMRDAAGRLMSRPAGRDVVEYLYWPRHAVGDRLWVREAWATEAAYDDLAPSAIGGDEPIHYDADGSHQTWGFPAIARLGRRRPSMFMPRWASRLTLTVTEVRVQRVQEISEDDAIAEGPGFVGAVSGEVCESSASHRLGIGPRWRNAREWYADLWDSLNSKRGYGWHANPWVAAISFRVARANIDSPPAADGAAAPERLRPGHCAS